MIEMNAASAAEPVNYLSPKLAVRPRRVGSSLGVFCLQPIQPGELLAVWGGRIVAERQLDRLNREQNQAAFPLENGLYLAPISAPEPANAFNHSCDPNAGLRGQIALVAMRDIMTGEEVCLDFAMYARAPHEGLACTCEAMNCRGRITRHDWQNPELRKRYSGYFSPFVQHWINLLAAGQDPGEQPGLAKLEPDKDLPLSTHYLSPKLAAGTTARLSQNGVFAVEKVNPGEVLTVWGGVVVSHQRLLKMGKYQQMLAVQIEEELHLAPFGPPEPADYFNHSCNPNAGLNGQNCLVALRSIFPGDEVCFDYATSDSTPYDEFECGCGEPECRGRITARDWQCPELIQRYQGYFSPYLEIQIKRSNSS